MKFEILVPTIRDKAQTAPILARVWLTLDYPFHLHLAEGSAGKGQTLNGYLARLAVSDADIYVTMDDNYVPPPGWMHAVARAFSVFDELGAVGLDISHTDEGRAYMMELPSLTTRYDVSVRFLEAQNIGGKFIAMRRITALQIGPIPIVDGTRYQFYEDGWRCGAVTRLGLRNGYVVSGRPELIHCIDSQEYIAAKQADVQKARQAGW